MKKGKIIKSILIGGLFGALFAIPALTLVQLGAVGYLFEIPSWIHPYVWFVVAIPSLTIDLLPIGPLLFWISYGSLTTFLLFFYPRYKALFFALSVLVLATTIQWIVFAPFIMEAKPLQAVPDIEGDVIINASPDAALFEAENAGSYRFFDCIGAGQTNASFSGRRYSYLAIAATNNSFQYEFKRDSVPLPHKLRPLEFIITSNCLRVLGQDVHFSELEGGCLLDIRTQKESLVDK